MNQPNPLIKTLQEGDEKLDEITIAYEDQSGHNYCNCNLKVNNRKIKSFHHSRSLKLLEAVKEMFLEHDAEILNEFQNQGKPDMPMIAYDERICLLPAMTIVGKKTIALLDEAINLYKK